MSKEKIKVVCVTDLINSELSVEEYADKDKESINDGSVEILALSSDTRPLDIDPALMAEINKNYLKRPTEYAGICRENDRRTQNEQQVR